ncbi:MAG TPA: ion channel [Sphingomicrobium sp.]|mgnify:CR=1 FL=1
MTDEVAVVDLGLQLAVVAGFILLMVVVHSSGLVAISRALHLHDEKALPNEFGLRASILMGTYGLLLFALHFVEIAIFAAFYRYVGAMHSMEEALYYSASCYATLGAAAENFAEKWRLVGALEALIGFVLIGWSTAFMVRTLRKIID